MSPHFFYLYGFADFNQNRICGGSVALPPIDSLMQIGYNRLIFDQLETLFNEEIPLFIVRLDLR